MSLTNLPLPVFLKTDPEVIKKEIIARYEEKTGKTLQPAQQESIMADIMAYRESLLRIAIQETAKQNLVDFAVYPMLDYLGVLVGVTRLEAQKALTTFEFSLEETLGFDVAIPSGTQIESKDSEVIFKTLENVIITAGNTSVTVSGEAETAGDAGNDYLAGEITELLSTVAYIDSVSNTTTSSGGADTESDINLRERIKLAPDSFSTAGPVNAYIFFARSAHQDIIDIAVTSPSACVINIYVLTKNGAATSEILDLVDEKVNDRDIRPLGDQVNVYSGTNIDFTITAGITLYNSADSSIIDDIEAKLEEYSAKLKAKLGKDIVPNQASAIINSFEGVYNHTLNTPASLTEVNENEWANCTGITLNITGYTDG